MSDVGKRTIEALKSLAEKPNGCRRTIVVKNTCSHCGGQEFLLVTLDEQCRVVRVRKHRGAKTHD